MSPARSTPPPDTWATFLRASRQAKRLTQEELADQASVARQTIIRWEKGERGADPDTLRKVTDVLGISYAAALSLLHGTDDVPLPPPLPRPLAQLVDVYNEMGDTDREDLLERVAWVVEWAEMRLAAARHGRSTRRTRRTG